MSGWTGSYAPSVLAGNYSYYLHCFRQMGLHDLQQAWNNVVGSTHVSPVRSIPRSNYARALDRAMREKGAPPDDSVSQDRPVPAAGDRPVGVYR